MMYRKAEVGTSILLVLISALTIHAASAFPQLEGSDVGAAFFPKMLSYLLIGLSILLFIKSVRGSKNEQTQSEKQTIDWKTTAFGIILTIAYIILIDYVGFYISTPLFLIGMMWMLQFRKVLPVILLSLGVTLFIYGIFEVLLQVPIPQGILFE